MKLYKYLLAVIIALAIVAAALHYKRETIARNIANSALSDLGLVATDLSIDTIATDHIVFSRLVLERGDGMRYELDGLAFPLGFPSLRPESVTLDRLRIVETRPSTEPTAIATALQTFLSLPETVPNTTISIAELEANGVPAIRDIRWQSTGDVQRLAFSSLTADLRLDLVPQPAGGHRATLAVSTNTDPDALHLPLAVARTNEGYSIEGNAFVHLRPWLPVLQSLDVLPAELLQTDAKLEGPIRLDVSDDSARSLAFTGELLVSGERMATYEIASDDSIRIRLDEGSLVAIEASYPGRQWRAGLARADFQMSSRFADDMRGRIADLVCSDEGRCQAQLAFDDVSLDLGEPGEVTASFASLVDIRFGSSRYIDFLPDTSLNVQGLKFAFGTVLTFLVDRVSGARLTFDDAGWRADIESANVDVRGSALDDALAFNVPVTLRSFRAADSATALNFTGSVAPGGATVSWKGAKIPAPGADGFFDLAGDSLAAKLDLADEQGALAAGISARHQLSSGVGDMTIRDASLHFDRRHLSGWMQDWPYAWDIVSGTWQGNANLKWSPGGDAVNLEGTVQQNVSALAGHYRDVAFTGLSTALSTGLLPDGGMQVEPATINVNLLDIGIPIENLSANFDLDLASRQFSVRDLSMAALGGRISADPFVYALQETSNNIMLRPESIQLQFMVDLAEFDDIELTGSISGRIPVNIGEEAITVTDGRLESDAPGGIIRYGSAALNAASGSDINVVSRALGNFQFDSLTSDVSYTETGDLKLKMRLSGINPDMDPLQPVILNLGVENNIPQLLRSLQATRAIEDVLQREGIN